LIVWWLIAYAFVGLGAGELAVKMVPKTNAATYLVVFVAWPVILIATFTAAVKAYRRIRR